MNQVSRSGDNYDSTNWRTEKMATIEKISQIAGELREQGKIIVTVNGCFDLLHPGHIDQLEEAKKQGDVLIMGLNSDASIKEKKGNSRPLISEQGRAAMLAALICVDYVVIINASYDDVQDELLRAVKPDIHANGEEYGEPEKWIEWSVMREVGAKGFPVTKRNDFSTSDIIGKIKAAD